MSVSTLTQQPNSSTARHALRNNLARGVGRRQTIKGQWIVLAGFLTFLAVALTLSGSISLGRAANDLNAIDSGSIPSVDAALSIAQYIEIIDAQSADFLATAGLVQTSPCAVAGLTTTPKLTTHDCDERNIDAETVLVNQQLFEAAHNVTYPGEQTAVERITIGLESYLGDIHQMRVDYGLAAGKTDPQDPSLRQAYQAYMNASNILNNQISLTTLNSRQIPFTTENNLPSCITSNGQKLSSEQWTQGSLAVALDCLSSINYSHLTSAYNDSANFLTDATWLLAILCILFGGLLCFAIGRMMVVSHRVLNPGLVAAILLCLFLSFNIVGLLGNLGAQSSEASQDGVFKQLVRDDYNSVYDAALLQRDSTDANADESRWLIAEEFTDQAGILHWQNDWMSNVQQINRLIQRAQANQTWNTELQPLADMHTYWDQYYALDAQIRATAQKQGNTNWLNNAETISTGPSDIAFVSFTNAVARLSQANRNQYTATLSQAQSSLSFSSILCLVLFPLSGLLAVWGIAIRFKDF